MACYTNIEFDFTDDLLAKPLDPAVKERLLKKLNRDYVPRHEVEAIVAKNAEEFHRDGNLLREENLALREACSALAHVLTLRGRRENV